MSVQPSPQGGAVERSQTSSLADVVTTILDKGVVIDVFARVSLVGIELLRADVRVVIASVDTYLRFAEAVNRLDLYSAGTAENIPTLIRGGARSKTRRALGGGNEEENGSNRDDEEREESGEEGDEEGSGGGIK